MISARIDSGRKIFKDEECHIRSSSLLGDSVLEFVTDTGHQSASSTLSKMATSWVMEKSPPIRSGAHQSGRGRSQRPCVVRDGGQQLQQSLDTTARRASGTNDDRLQRMMEKSE